jgi:murein L,D-transpeptidase YafK
LFFQEQKIKRKGKRYFLNLEFSKKISTKQTEESKIISKLLQLKFLIEDYITSNSSNGSYYFEYFLQEYIKRLEKKNNQFAGEIGVDVV